MWSFLHLFLHFFHDFPIFLFLGPPLCAAPALCPAPLHGHPALGREEDVRGGSCGGGGGGGEQRRKGGQEDVSRVPSASVRRIPGGGNAKPVTVQVTKKIKELCNILLSLKVIFLKLKQKMCSFFRTASFSTLKEDISLDLSTTQRVFLAIGIMGGTFLYKKSM